MFENLSQRLSGVIKNLRGQARLSEENIQDALREVRMALLEADVAVPVVKDFIERIRKDALGEEVMGSLTPGQAVVGIVHRELVRLMGERNDALNLHAAPPAVILMAGLQGAGKTTTAGKLAKLLREQRKKKVLLASCDVYRPAAIEQLRVLADQIGADFFAADTVSEPVRIASAALDHARRHFHDVLIVDTAGRLAIDQAMMREIADLHGAVKPIETLFVVDAMQGQDAVNTAKAFAAALPLTGIVLTKLDGDARGGAALSVRHITGKPIKFIGVGEKLTGLEAFHPERMASRILGMGDVLSLIERAEQAIDIEEAQKLEEKVRKDDFTLEDFREQLQAIKKMGPLEQIIGMIPGMGNIKQLAQQKPDDKQIGRIEAMISSMTPYERRRSDVINGSRRKRIARGSGTTVEEVNRLLKQFVQMRKMLKVMGGMASGKPDRKARARLGSLMGRR